LSLANSKAKKAKGNIAKKGAQKVYKVSDEYK